MSFNLGNAKKRNLKEKTTTVNNNSSSNKYISKVLKPSVSDLHQVQSAGHVQIKPSKQTNQHHQEKVVAGWMKGQGQSIKYTTN